MKIDELIKKINLKIPLNYGRGIIIVSKQVINSSLREKRFYLSALYFVVIPVFLNLLSMGNIVVQKGSGIALFYAHTTLLSYIKTYLLSFFLGQILLVILAADLIAGEMESNTLTVLKAKPIHDSEIIIGKFIGSVTLISILDLPGMIIIYFAKMISLEAQFPYAYVHTLDELIGAFLLIVLLQGIIISMTLFFSSIFSKSLYAILSAMLTLFMLSTIADTISAKGGDVYNYISFTWLVDAAIPSILYHIEPLDLDKLPELWQFVIAFILVIVLFLTGSTYILRNKEIM